MFLDVSLEKLGTKPGDKIGLQLLHCDDGWDFVMSTRRNIPKGWKRALLPELSNQIEFIAK